MIGGPVVPIHFDLSALVRRSVASLYSHLVTRPTGQALRLGIQSQIGELGSVCVSILDFAQVVVLDYSCADEAVAKLIRHYIGPDRPAEVFFVARGVDDHHRETLEAVLVRHGLALAAELVGEGYTVLGEIAAEGRSAWRALHDLREAAPADIAEALSLAPSEAEALLAELAARRLAIPRPDGASYVAVSALAGDPRPDHGGPGR